MSHSDEIGPALMMIVVKSEVVKTWAHTELAKLLILIQSSSFEILLHWNAYNKGTFCGRFKAYPARAHTELTERALLLRLREAARQGFTG